MTMFPALTLCPGTLCSHWEVAKNDRGGAELRSMTGGREIKSEFQILNNRSARELNGAQDCPWKRHAGPHQLTRQAKGLQSKRPNPVFHPPGECRNLGGEGR